MSVHDAQPADIYVDKQGKLWRCVGICHEPTAIFEEVEGRTPDPPEWASAGVGGTGFYPDHVFLSHGPRKVEIIRARVSGGVTGLMWEGWKRIYRGER